MKNKGFTLIELLGVIVILALLMVLVMPKIINSLKSSSEKVDDLTLEMIYNAAELYVDEYKDEFKTVNGNKYCITLTDLTEEEYLKAPINVNDTDITSLKTVQVTYNEGFKYELVNNDECVATTTLAQHITNLYTPNSTVVNNGITYNIDTTNGIIDDGLGGTQASGGNLRYYGANPNNYVDIGDEDENGNPILWRIIGLFETKYATDSLPCDTDSDSDGHFDNCASDKLVKIIRDDSIGDFSWDYTSTGEYDGNWGDSTLKTMLNGAYYNSTTIDYYNYSTTSTTVNFANEGLSSNVRSKIENVLWNLGGHDDDEIYTNDMYIYERGTARYNTDRPTEWVGKVGLMYPSDYGYATDLTKCSENLYNYNSSVDSYACRTNDWLYNSKRQWTLTSSSGIDKRSVIYVTYNGEIINGHFYACSTNQVRPVLYLKSDVSITGEGTTSDGIKYKIVE